MKNSEWILVGLLALCCLAPVFAALGLFAWLAATGYGVLATLGVLAVIVALFVRRWRHEP